MSPHMMYSWEWWFKTSLKHYNLFHFRIHWFINWGLPLFDSWICIFVVFFLIRQLDYFSKKCVQIWRRKVMYIWDGMRVSKFKNVYFPLVSLYEITFLLQWGLSVQLLFETLCKFQQQKNGLFSSQCSVLLICFGFLERLSLSSGWKDIVC